MVMVMVMVRVRVRARVRVRVRVSGLRILDYKGKGCITTYWPDMPIAALCLACVGSAALWQS